MWPAGYNFLRQWSLKSTCVETVVESVSWRYYLFQTEWRGSTEAGFAFDTVFKKILEMGLEPMTLGLLDLRSNRLSYTSSCDDVIEKTLLYILQYIVYHRSRSNSLLDFVGLWSFSISFLVGIKLGGQIWGYSQQLSRPTHSADQHQHDYWQLRTGIEQKFMILVIKLRKCPMLVIFQTEYTSLQYIASQIDYWEHIYLEPRILHLETADHDFCTREQFDE